MGKYQPYPEYKSSGSKLLGEIPEGWKATQVKHVGNLKGGAGFPHAEQGVENEALDFHKVNALGKADAKGFLENSENTISIETAKRLGAYIFPEKSIVFAKVGAALLLARIRSLKAEACIDNNMMGLVVHDKHDSNFIKYAMNTIRFDFIVNPGAVPSLNEFQMGNLFLAIPERYEQEKIANFLDHETAKIDTLIEKQQQLIKLLKEKRQAVISHAVTKGLPSPTGANVPMRDSGVEWLGEVPEHWEVSQLKYKVKPGTSITYGIVQAGPHVENGIPYIKTSDMSGSELPIAGYSKTSEAIDDSYKRSKVYEGDIVMAIRATVGKCLPVPQEISGANLTQGTAKIAPGSDLSTEYLLSYLSSSQVQTHLNSMAKGATFKEITLDMLRRVSVLVPPQEEQDLIAEKVSLLGGKFTKLISASEEQMRLLSERRTALISAAVTGKIDVRNWQAPEPTDNQNKEVAE